MNAPMKKDRATRRDFLQTAMAASAAIFPLPAMPQEMAAHSFNFVRCDKAIIGGGIYF
jgi:hypothetical protein